MDIALIDADIIAYSVGFNVDNTYYMVGKKKFKYHKTAAKWCDDHRHNREEIIKYHEEGDPVKALDEVDALVSGILSATDASDYKLFITGEGNFREQVAVTAPYKGNREKSHKPHHFNAIRDYLVNKWGAEVVNGMEADDALGIHQCSTFVDKETVICSLDKDLLMIPGWHYNWRKKEWQNIDYYQGWYNFYSQLLTGDRTDNIQGIHKVGPRTAECILKPCGDPIAMMCEVGHRYALEFDNPEERMLENAHLLYIRKKDDETYNFEIHNGG